MFKITSIETTQVAELPKSITIKGFTLPGSNRRWQFKQGAKEKLTIGIAATAMVAIIVSNPWDGTIHTQVINGVQYVMTR